MAIIRRQCMMKEEVTVPHTHCGGFPKQSPTHPHENPYKLAPNPMLKHLSTTTQNTTCNGAKRAAQAALLVLLLIFIFLTKVILDPLSVKPTKPAEGPQPTRQWAKHSTTHPLRRVCGNTCCPLDAKTPRQEHTKVQDEILMRTATRNPIQNTPTELQTKHEPMWTPALQYKMEVPYTHLGGFSPSVKPHLKNTPTRPGQNVHAGTAMPAPMLNYPPPIQPCLKYDEVHSLCNIRPNQCTDQIQERQECTATHTPRPSIFPNVYEDATPAEAEQLVLVLLFWHWLRVPPLCDTPPNDMIREPSPQHLQHTQQWTPHTRSGGCVVISGKMAPKEQQELLFWSPLPQMKPDPTRTRTEPQHGIWTCAVAEDLA
ncbi:hypothetical protein BS47DRAFT_1367487 [Hydnum rufescens UP504]|uniref:Uncharacterized protein n=1 Tax=Hydnum rufescens UP504 TaxID=1448309 RepID=A0A9P6DKN3_9AGAM|nr:hypothetical protein BS47DRAFT_1367487 [Hydnum rufescens UP504]